MQIQEIDKREIWETFLAKTMPESFFQSWSWGEVIKKAIGNRQKMWRYGMYDKKRLIGVAQIEKVHAKKGTFLHVRHGPVLASWNKKIFSELLLFLKRKAKEEHCHFIRMSPLQQNTPEIQQFFRSFGFFPSPIHALDAELCWVLDLDISEEALLAHMRKTTRYLIRQAEKLGVEIRTSQRVADIQEFLTLYKVTADRHHFVQHTRIAEEFAEFVAHDQALLFQGYYEKKLLSAAIVLFYNTQAIYHHSASIEQKIPVNYLLQWRIIQEAKRRQCKQYNFWGIAPEGNIKHPWRGLTLFKTGFGGRKVEYLHAQDLPLSLIYCATYCFEVFRKIWKGY